MIYSDVDGFQYRIVEVVVERGDMSQNTSDVVSVSTSRETYGLKWSLPSGEGERHTVQLLVSNAQGDTFLSNVMTLDYDVARIDRVVTTQ